DRDLEQAIDFPADKIDAIRHRVFCSDNDGYMLIPSFAGIPSLGRAMFEAIDIHGHAPCPLEGWLREELEALAAVAEQRFGWSKAAILQEIRVECIGGKRGIDPELYEIAPAGDVHRILISHTFYHVFLVAARACAARMRIHKDEAYNDVDAREIHQSLSDIL